MAFGEGHTLLDLVNFISDEIKIEPKYKIEETLIGEVNYYVANISKARNLLGYKPSTNLRDGIRKAIVWQKSFYGW